MGAAIMSRRPLVALLLKTGCPFQADFVGWLIVFPLRHVLLAAVVEAENLVVKVQALHLEPKPR